MCWHGQGSVAGMLSVSLEWSESQGLLLEKIVLRTLHLQTPSSPQRLIWKSLLSDATTSSFERSPVPSDALVMPAFWRGSQQWGAFPKS